jgi:hypothetical protein
MLNEPFPLVKYLFSFDAVDILETTQIYHNNKYHSFIMMTKKADSTERYILPDYMASHPRRH